MKKPIKLPGRLSVIVIILAAALLLAGCSEEKHEAAAEKSTTKLDVCKLVSTEQLQQVYAKDLIAAPDGSGGCMWSIKEGGMAYLHITVQKKDREIREYFNSTLPANVTLEKITDLGDGGLMTVAEGTLGVIVIGKDNRILKSAATFLDIEPGSKQQQALFSIYRKILGHL